MIKTLKQHGVYQKDIAEQIGVHTKTVSRELKRNGAPIEAPFRDPAYYQDVEDRAKRTSGGWDPFEYTDIITTG